jgi:pimeloyl-ACP methyl ester carboxylesterase
MKPIFAAALLAATAALASGTAGAAPTPAAAQPANAEASSPFSTIVEGKGPDVILIPGLMSGRNVWDGAAASLGGKYRLHRLQVKGFAGEAPVKLEGPLLPGIVEQLHAYILANHLKQPRIVGHSMGGLIGLMLADAHPEDVGSLLVVDALPFAGTMFGPTITVEAIEPQAAAMRSQIAAMSDDAFRSQEAATAATLSLTEGGRAKVLQSAMASDRATGAQAFYEDITTDLRPRMKSIATPITVAYAANPAAPQAEGLFTAGYADTPHVRLVPVEGSAHFIMYDQPEKFQALLSQFLAD